LLFKLNDQQDPAKVHTNKKNVSPALNAALRSLVSFLISGFLLGKNPSHYFLSQ